jgi:hypothetical protein
MSRERRIPLVQKIKYDRIIKDSVSRPMTVGKTKFRKDMEKLLKKE